MLLVRLDHILVLALAVPHGVLSLPESFCSAHDDLREDESSMLQVGTIATSKAGPVAKHLGKVSSAERNRSQANLLTFAKTNRSAEIPIESGINVQQGLHTSWDTDLEHSVHAVVWSCAISLGMMVLLWSSYGLNCWTHPQAYLMLNCTSLVVCSWGMNIVNKSLVIQLQSPTLVTAAQMVMTLLVTALLSGGHISGSSSEIMKWSLISLVLFAMLVSSFYTYQYLTLSVLMIVRNFGPLVTLPIEKMVMPADAGTPITVEMVAAIVLILLSTFLYLSHSSYSRIGFACAVVNMVLAVFDRVLQRWLLITHCKDLTIETCMLVSNFFGLFPTMLLALAIGEFAKFDSEAWLTPLTMVLLLLSSVIGSGICYFTIAIQREISATSYLVLQNAVRVAAVAMGIAVFHDPIGGPWRISGLFASFLGSLWYGCARISAARRQKNGPAVSKAESK